MEPFSLDRFRTAQDAGGTYARALAELRAGRKTTHWIWFVFPQLAGLGRSETARRYAIGSIAEARAYAADAVLGPRLVEAAEALLSNRGRSAAQILGGLDAMKVSSSMTLFARAAGDTPAGLIARRVLAAFYAGREDPLTVERLVRPGG